ncbi:MAG: hypothetical protein WC565_06210 [Parcubacteria group bacterium]
MAAKRKTSSSRTVVVQQPKAAAPIIRVSAPRAPAVHRRKRSGGRRVSGGGGTPKDMIGAGIGGAVYGFVEKQWGAKIPTIPILGRAGTVAVVCYFARKQGGMGRSPLVRDLGMAAAVIAGYQLGSTGKISGEDLDGDVDVVGGNLAQQI